MEISITPAIRSICEFRQPLFTQFRHLPNSKPSISSSSIRHSAVLSSPKSSQKWRNQLTVTRSLADETTVAVNSTPETDKADASLPLKKKATDLSADLKGTSIFLVGMNNAMKTNVGNLMANVLRYYYFDSDSVVEEAAGEDSSGKSFKERDENSFRASEVAHMVKNRVFTVLICVEYKVFINDGVTIILIEVGIRGPAGPIILNILKKCSNGFGFVEPRPLLC